jgi:biotin-(acetyl-CoA carboxylase) ligase
MDERTLLPGEAVSVVEGPQLVLTVPVGSVDTGWVRPAAALAVADALRSAACIPAGAAYPDAVTLPRAQCGGAGSSVRVATVDLDGALLTVRLQLTGSVLDLPSGWTSVYAEGGVTDVDQIRDALVEALGARLGQLASGASALRDDYRVRCVTIGRLLTLPGGTAVVTGISAQGRLLASVDGAEVEIAPEHVPTP